MKLKKWQIILIIILVVGVVGMFAGGTDDNSSNSQGTDIEEVKPKEYKQYSADTLITDLDENALSAEKKYNDQYIEVTGIISNIDSSGDYIDIEGTKDNYSLVSIQGYVQDDSQLDMIQSFKKGDKIIVKGKVTDVGEVLGYSIDIDEISKSK